MNITKHGMEECKAVENQRTIYYLRMKLYNVQEKPKQSNINHVINEAMRRKCVMKVVCEFLLEIRNWTYVE